MTPRRRWLDEGLDLLATSGVNGVTIQALCERLGLSKGSFYHHFKGMAGYRTALLEHFEERETRRSSTWSRPFRRATAPTGFASSPRRRGGRGTR
jgi:AcrR family transcriptional regulator